ncbi:MAG: molecular chaperone [Firmicutes bacterium HGW-Firmicutes-14]|jgi:HSP20 family protein|nr:MAG: molecular chaperone [Firmicutes bacterium HGW-Firmicutes-14]
MSLVRWDPFRELSVLQNSIARLFDENYGRGTEKGGLAQGWMFPVDVRENPEAIVVKAELPGLTRDDIKVSFNDNLMTIYGERKKEEKEEKENFLRIERSYGSFSRTFSLDVPVKQDDIKARYKDGVLEITLPKAEQPAGRDIDIEVE